VPPSPTPTPTPTPYTFQDLGGCACCPCWPCPLPLETLTVTRTGVGAISLFYEPNFCTWNSGCYVTNAGVTNAIFTIQCFTSCVYFEETYYAAPGCSTLSGLSPAFYDHPSGCIGIGAPTMTLSSYSCNPLSIVLTQALITWTITL
jgi:hypothetical protein